MAVNSMNVNIFHIHWTKIGEHHGCVEIHVGFEAVVLLLIHVMQKFNIQLRIGRSLFIKELIGAHGLNKLVNTFRFWDVWYLKIHYFSNNSGVS